MKAYIDKTALVAEIEKELNTTKKYSTEYVNGKKYALKKILSFLDTLEVIEVEEEPVSKDLEEAADKHLVEKGYLLTTKNGEHLAEVEAKGLFKAGAKWHKEQMIDKACEWLSNVSIEDMHYQYNDFDTSEGWYKFIEEFKKAMEE